MTASEDRCPVVYGEPVQVAALLDWAAKLMAVEPVEVWADAGVRRSARQLTALATRRIAEAAPQCARPAPRPIDIRVAS
jgi:hypothetical protein